MAAPAAARPKPAHSTRGPVGKVPIPELILKTGYIPMIQTYRNVIKHCTSVEQGIIWHIYENTVGNSDDGRPEWVAVSAPQMAKALGCSVDAVNLAIAEIGRASCRERV